MFAQPQVGRARERSGFAPPRRAAMALLLLLATGLLAACATAPAAGDPAQPGTRQALGWLALMQGDYGGEVRMSAFAPPANATPPSHRFEGTLRLSGDVDTRTVRLRQGYVPPRQLQAARSFPADFAYDFVQHGDVLLPVIRGYIPTGHPHWDLVLEPGRVWDEPGDHGLTRAALPFALVQKNMNCTHYGVLSFLFGDAGKISDAALQINSETCHYLKFDMWGLLDAEYRPHAVQAQDSLVSAWRTNQAAKLPTRPIAQLAREHPGLDLSRLVIGEDNARTLYGLVVDGIHYVSPCPTRRGPYPYCEVLPLPSYSAAKSAEAGLAFMAVAQAHPEMPQLTVAEWAPVPGCATAGWSDVTLRNLINMSSGHFDSTAYMADEGNIKMRGFFRAISAQQKARFACNAWPRQAEPGTVWVYHTSDTFLLGDILNRYLRSRSEQRVDVFRDVVVGKIYAPLDLSATARVTRRTADRATQPLFGYGLQLHRDDFARLARFIATAEGRIDGRQVLDPELLAQALQKVPGERGFVVTGYPDFRYQLGFWARDLAPVLGCPQPLWVPFMSGYGGISVVMYPNGVIYYNVSDSGSAAAFDWSGTAALADKLEGMCR